MFYPATNECLLNSADSSTSQLESEVDGSEVNYFEFHKLKCRSIEVSNFFSEISLKFGNFSLFGSFLFQFCIVCKYSKFF